MYSSIVLLKYPGIFFVVVEELKAGWIPEHLYDIKRKINQSKVSSTRTFSKYLDFHSSYQG